MSLTLNGQSTTLPPHSAVIEAVKQFPVEGKRYAVELNGEIVPKSQHATTSLKDGDKIEIVIAVGGG
ncbi:MAG: sulfur carrier protein ThiS [Betaproteobacteria bacterium]|nr:sulfur carrier protein ThiS [Betaproteobacteria bacterium]